MKNNDLLNKILSSFSFKIGAIAVLCLLLLIPLSWIQEVIFERKQISDEVRTEVAQSWSEPQTLVGPILHIPVDRMRSDSSTYRVGVLKVLPEKYQTEGKLDTKALSRSIHEVITYSSELSLHAEFDPAKYYEPELIYRTDKAYVSLGVTDVRGIAGEFALKVDGKEVSPESGIPDSDDAGVHFPLQAKDGLEVMMDLKLNGTGKFQWVPVGKVSSLDLQSDWASPSFFGSQLPQEREVKDGFTASWKVMDINREFPQSWMSDTYDLAHYGLGVELMEPVNHYAKSERSVKYGLLFILLTFVIFLISEKLLDSQMHVAKYVLVGGAVCTFYLLLLSLSEHVSFNLSFLIAAAAVIFLNATYFYRELRKLNPTWIATGCMVLLYSYLFVLLQLEDHALLAGSVGLFLILFFLMWITSSRKFKLQEAAS